MRQEPLFDPALVYAEYLSNYLGCLSVGVQLLGRHQALAIHTVWQACLQQLEKPDLTIAEKGSLKHLFYTFVCVIISCSRSDFGRRILWKFHS